MTTLKSPDKLEVKTSPIHGYGVFAKQDISKDEIIEECYLLTIPFKLGEFNSFLINYKFNYPSSGEIKEYVIPLGFGSIYNHSNNNNAFWRTNETNKTFEFVANRDIKTGEEICTFYGDSEYWKIVEELSNKKIKLI